MNLKIDAFDSLSGDMVDTIVNIAISVARGHMQQYRAYKIRAEADRQAGNEYMERAMRLYAESYRLQAYAATMGIRLAIEIRTENERRQAERQVERGQVRFLYPACGDEGCDTCDAPLWHHVVDHRGLALCPSGRQYWTYARALAGEYTGDAEADDSRRRSHIREVAQRVR